MTLRRLLTTGFLMIAVVFTSGCLSMVPGLRFGEVSEGEILVTRATDLNRDNAHAWMMQGHKALADGKNRAARTYYNRALRAQPGMHEARYGIALAEIASRRWSSARKRLEQLRTELPSAVHVEEALAEACYGAGDMSAARAAATRAIALSPTTARANRTLGNIAYIEANYALALKHWETAMASDPVLTHGLEPVVRDLRGYLARYPATP